MEEGKDKEALNARRIAVPESRELDRFSSMLERHGARVLRCPLVLVRSLEDTTKLDAWLQRLVQRRHHALAFYTGEGVTRIVQRAEQLTIKAEALAAIGSAQTIARGPKPVAALRKHGMGADLVTDLPTTDGLIALFQTLPLQGRCVGVQMYPEGPAAMLAEALRQLGAEFDPILPYEYAPNDKDEEVAILIREMAVGQVDLIAFTSKLQVERLCEVAQSMGLEEELQRGLKTTTVAAIGPVAADAIMKAGGTVQIQPASNFHLKPLVSEIVRVIGYP